jgi:hypothetical protein
MGKSNFSDKKKETFAQIFLLILPCIMPANSTKTNTTLDIIKQKVTCQEKKNVLVSLHKSNQFWTGQGLYQKACLRHTLTKQL